MSPGVFKLSLIAVKVHPGEMVSNCRAGSSAGPGDGKLASASACCFLLLCCSVSRCYKAVFKCQRLFKCLKCHCQCLSLVKIGPAKSTTYALFQQCILESCTGSRKIREACAGFKAGAFCAPGLRSCHSSAAAHTSSEPASFSAALS